MTKHFASFEELIADEDFLAWYAGADTMKAKRWAKWLSENPKYASLNDEGVLYLNTLRLKDKPVSARQTEKAHDRLMQVIEQEAPVVQMRSSYKKWWLSAAAVVLLVVTGALLWKGGDSPLKLNTEYGQVAAYTLPDGSEVMLNANSRVSMKKGWKGTGDREVWMEGEAFFHVRKTSAKDRFIVHTNEMDIIVTGTQFNVVNRDGESNILLKEGSVTLRTPGGNLTKMKPGDFIKISNRLPQKETAPAEKILAWTQAKLVFENTNMATAAKAISQHYGVKVVLDKEVEAKKISGILPNDNLEVLLKALEATMDFQIARKNGEITISNPK